MKHEPLIKRILAELHEPWMDEQDKAEFDAQMIQLFGAKLDEDVDTGIANGFTEAQQENIARSILRAMNR